MIAEPSMHPQKEQLIAFGQGKLADEESSRVEQHLEICRECCETLLDLRDDTFVGLVRIAKPHDHRGQDEHTDGHIADSSEPAATVLGAMDETLPADELPASLWEHPRYRIVELIGKGGMGVVYRAEHRLMNRSVAIKLINPHLVQHPQAVERFRREVQAAAKLSHANIVTAHDAEQAGNAHFLVMEFVEGTDLASVVQERGPMSVAAACDCIRQAAAGLQHAHERGMVHRDIKPHNLMISPDGQVRILDFGLANFATEIALIVAEAQASDGKSDSEQQLTTFGSVMGTPDYIAPEQARDAHTADIRADIYSLGCTLYYLLIGKLPFDAQTAIDKLKAHVEQPPPALDRLRPDVPGELAAIVARMMAKSPAERFQTPAEVVAALAPFAQVASPPPKWMGRIVGSAVLLAAALLAAVVIHVQTDKGEFIIEAADDVAVQIDKAGVKIRDTETGREYRLKPGKHPIRSGTYQIDVTELPSGLELSTDKFRLTRGGEERVTVRLKPQELVQLDRSALNEVEQQVLKSAEAFLKVADEDQFDQLYDISSMLAKRAATREQASKHYQLLRDTVGKAAHRTLQRLRLIDEWPGLPAGRYAAVEYKTNFASRTGLLWESVLLNFDTDGQWRINTYAATLEPLPIPEPKEAQAADKNPGDDPKQAAATAVARDWLKLADAGKFAECWESCAEFAKLQITKEQVAEAYAGIRKPLGTPKGRTRLSANVFPRLPGTPPGECVVVQFETDFASQGKHLEQVTLYWDQDKQWRVAGYHVTPVNSDEARGDAQPIPE